MCQYTGWNAARQGGFYAPTPITLQGIGLSHVAFGETDFVIALGLVGQLPIALLKANSSRVTGTD
jgi:hypothetical protein